MFIGSSVVGELFVHRWGGEISRYAGRSPMCSGLLGGANGLGAIVRADTVRDVVDAARGPGMAAQEASGGKPRTAQEAEPLDGGQCIGGAGRVEPTRRRPRR